ncbi:hypothetical protein GA0116948_106156 [Chitinophaga costaii]|uniref:Uncharacterized protein n=1 Tax=Chitinophaga costaii TaxID=1335309 RepID=A0A1C4DW83_9BACT|nr:hypothetical protein [Chitinophaga costaii]SCC35618.1 hypothetical protein GA0116948_106156 [Chitinophaga costaii]
MKKVMALLALVAILAESCSSTKTGCPGSNYYSKQDRVQSRKAQRQKTLF